MPTVTAIYHFCIHSVSPCLPSELAVTSILSVRFLFPPSEGLSCCTHQCPAATCKSSLITRIIGERQKWKLVSHKSFFLEAKKSSLSEVSKLHNSLTLGSLCRQTVAKRWAEVKEQHRSSQIMVWESTDWLYCGVDVSLLHVYHLLWLWSQSLKIHCVMHWSVPGMYCWRKGTCWWQWRLSTSDKPSFSPVQRDLKRCAIAFETALETCFHIGCSHQIIGLVRGCYEFKVWLSWYDRAGAVGLWTLKRSDILMTVWVLVMGCQTCTVVFCEAVHEKLSFFMPVS